MAKIDWADELIKYQGVTEITREIVERFIEKSCGKIRNRDYRIFLVWRYL